MTALLRALRAAAAVALCLLAVLVTVTLRARGWPVVPDLALVPVLAVGLSRGAIPGALLGLAAGWIIDLVPPGASLLGVTPLLYAAAGALAGCGTRLGPLPVRWVAVVALGVCLVPAVGRLLQGAWLGQQLDVTRTATEVVLTLLVAVIVVPPLVRLDKEDETW